MRPHPITARLAQTAEAISSGQSDCRTSLARTRSGSHFPRREGIASPVLSKAKGLLMPEGIPSFRHCNRRGGGRPRPSGGIVRSLRLLVYRPGYELDSGTPGYSGQHIHGQMIPNLATIRSIESCEGASVHFEILAIRSLSWPSKGVTTSSAVNI